MELSNPYELQADYILDTEYHVLFVKSNKFETDHKDLIHDINVWTRQSCSTIYNSCFPYESCKSFVCLAFDQTVALEKVKDISTLSTWINSNMSKIGAMCVNIIFDDNSYLDNKGFSEIYNVCTRNIYRKQGYASRLLKAVVKLSIMNLKFDNVWLGVFPDNPDFDAALSLYLKSGFAKFEIADKTPGGKDMGRDFIGMTFSKSNKQEVKYDALFSTVKELQNIINNKKVERLFLSLSKNLTDYLYKYVSEYSVEYAGVLTVINKGNNIWQLGFPKSTETIGGGENKSGKLIDCTYDFTVATPLSMFSFHTHPKLAYILLQAYVGWPSGEDFSYIIYNFKNGLLKHFIPTNEGIYDIQISPEFMYFLATLNDNDCITNIALATLKYFQQTHSYRSGDLIDPKGVIEARKRKWYIPFLELTQKKVDVISKFLNEANMFTIDKLTSQLDKKYHQCFKKFNFYKNPIFIVGFNTWNDINTRGGYITDVKYLSSYNKVLENTSVYITKQNNEVII